jgi:hypothetical protein
MRTEEQYRQAEINRHTQDIARTLTQSKADRTEAMNAFVVELLTNRDHFYQSVEFLLCGNYGAGAYYSFCKLSTKMNRLAWLFITVAALEYQVPNVYARKVWKNLNPDIQAKINRHLSIMIAKHDREPACG